MAAAVVAAGSADAQSAGATVVPGAAGPVVQDEATLLGALREDPADAGARLALGRLYYETRRDRAAEFNIRQALASGLDRGGREAARALLADLQRRRRWVFTADAALAPETTRVVTRTVTAGDGMPVTRSETESSGIGIEAFADLEYRAPLGEDLRISVEGFAQTEQFAEEDFGRSRLVGFAGPLFLLDGDNRWSVRGLVERSWDGGEPEFQGVGAEVSTRRTLTDRLRLFARAQYRDLDYDSFDARDGQSVGVDADLGRFGLGGRFERVFGVAFRADTMAEDQSFWFYRAGVGAFRELPYAIGVYVQPSVAFQSFDGPGGTDTDAREDVETDMLFRVSKRDWRVLSAAPFVSVEVSYRDSNIDRLDDTDTAFQAGFTRSF
ncbi:MAG: surface lipoprotein assembly modifier [Pseudomonadota bacterium]